MKIAIMAGKNSKKIETVLRKYSLDLKLYPEISEGLQHITMSVSVEQMLLMDEALIKEGRLLDLEQIFTALDELVPVNEDMEILFVTRSQTAYDLFTEVMATNPNARCELVTRLNSHILFECINGSFKEIVQEIQEEEAPDIGSVVEEIEPPEPIPEPEPVKEKIPKPVKEKVKKVKEKPVKKEKVNLNDLITMNQIVIVTGNPNSGVTSTFCGIADVLQDNDVDTIMVDMDIYSKGVTMYYPQIDGGCNVTVKNGLKNALKDLDNIGESVLRVTPKLSYIGLTSDTSHKFLWEILTLKYETCDLAHMLAEDFRIVLMHVPLEILLENPTLIRDCNSIIYCTNGTINGIQSIDKHLNKQHLIDRDKHASFRILHRKMNYILTNYIKNTIAPEEWLKVLLEATEEKSLHRYILGTIPHLIGFDDFENNKTLITENKEQSLNFFNMLVNLFKI